MPVRVKRRIRRTYRRKTNDGVKALKIVKTLVKAVEVKTDDLAISSSAIINGSANGLISIGVGDSSSERTGDKVTFKSMHIRGLMTANTANAGWVRVLIVRFPGPLLGPPLATTFMDTASPHSLFKVSSPFKYSVVYDTTRFLSDDSSHPPKEWLWDKYVKIKNTNYHTDGSNIRNQYVIYYLHDMSSANLSFNATVRTKYVDP